MKDEKIYFIYVDGKFKDVCFDIVEAVEEGVKLSVKYGLDKVTIIDIQDDCSYNLDVSYNNSQTSFNPKVNEDQVVELRHKIEKAFKLYKTTTDTRIIEDIKTIQSSMNNK